MADKKAIIKKQPKTINNILKNNDPIVDIQQKINDLLENAINKKAVIKELYSHETLTVFLKLYLSDDEIKEKSILNFCNTWKIPYKTLLNIRKNSENDYLNYLIDMLETEEIENKVNTIMKSPRMSNVQGNIFALKSLHKINEEGIGENKASSQEKTLISINFNETPKKRIEYINSLNDNEDEE